MGAARALEALEIRPAVWHLNEGHSALVLLERARVVQAAEPGLDAVSALRRAGRDMAMTLHTPVPAGNERYEPDLALEVLADPNGRHSAWHRTSCAPWDTDRRARTGPRST